MDLRNILVEAHSGLRWLVVVGVAAVLVYALIAASSSRPYRGGWVAVVTAAVDLQVLIGLVLWFMAPGWEMSTFFAVVHPVAMLAAAAAWHIGAVRARRSSNWATLAIFAVVAAILLGVAIPWDR